VSYNIAGFPDFRTDEDGVISSFEYDPVYGRLARRIDNKGNYITYNYDAQGNLIEKSYYNPTDNRTYWKRAVYQDPAHTLPGKLFKTINADETFTKYEYDSEGNIASVTDPNVHTTYYDYDALNRLTTVSQPVNVITSYGYDLHGNLSSVIDAESHETTYEYDDMGRVLTTTSPDTGTVFYAYDEAGNLTNKTDANGISVGYTYDILNRLINVGFPVSSQDIGYTYDTGAYGMGQRTGITEPSGSTTFGYDSRGRLVQKTCALDAYTYSTDRTFSPGSRVISTTYPSSRTVDYTRNSIGKISRVSTTGNGITTTLINNLLYLPFGPSSGMDMGAGSGVTNVFDELNRTIVTNPGAETERTYTYDANSNLTSINVTNDVGKNKTFTYDALNRLKYAEGPFGYIDYTYDGVGNRLTKVENNQTITYMYASGTNRLQEITGPVAFTYDANGNVTGIDNKVLIYNQNNRLVQVEENSTILVEYIYNGLGQRVKKTANGLTIIFLYDFDGNLIAESQDDGTIISEYLYMGTSRIARVNVGSGEICYFHNDHLGAPELMTDASGNAVWEAEFKPFGEAAVKSTSIVKNNFRLPGQIFDEESGLHYNYFRDYYSGIGRYIEPDPIGLEGGINLFAYANLNPINEIDLFGLIDDFIRDWTGQNASEYIGSAWAHDVETVQYTNWWNQRQAEIHKRLAQDFEDLSNRERSILRVMDPIPPSNKPIGWYMVFVQMYHLYEADYWQVKAMKEWELYKDYSNILPLQPQISTPTIPEEYTPLPEPQLPFQYDPNNPDEIDPNSSISLNVIGGCSPYTWSVSGTDGFTLEKEGQPIGPNNKLYADETACGPAEISVIDCDGNPVGGVVRCSVGIWTNIFSCPVTPSCNIIFGKYLYTIVPPFFYTPDGPSCEVSGSHQCTLSIPELDFIDWCAPGGPYGDGVIFSNCSDIPDKCELPWIICPSIYVTSRILEWSCPE
jgi:RHS repeat-associated protein